MTEVSAKLAALRAAKEAREEARRQAFEAQEVELLELEARLEEELGPRGRSFEIVDCRDLGEGFVAVKLGASVLHKRFVNSKQTEADVDGYVTPCLAHPTVEVYRVIVERRPHVAIRAANALVTLFGFRREEDAKKF